MHALDRLDELVKLMELGIPLYLGYSPGPDADDGHPSIDHESGLPMPGHSANPLDPPGWWTLPVEDWLARFTLGVGAGENLNERVIGRGWPPVNVRHDKLVEAVQIIGALFDGGYVDYAGDHFRIDSAKLWDLPEIRVPIAAAVSGGQALCSAWDDLHHGESAKIGQLPVCWDTDRPVHAGGGRGRRHAVRTGSRPDHGRRETLLGGRFHPPGADVSVAPCRVAA